jgi:hypothetical protein
VGEVSVLSQPVIRNGNVQRAWWPVLEEQRIGQDGDLYQVFHFIQIEDCLHSKRRRAVSCLKSSRIESHWVTEIKLLCQQGFILDEFVVYLTTIVDNSNYISSND